MASPGCLGDEASTQQLFVKRYLHSCIHILDYFSLFVDKV